MWPCWLVASFFLQSPSPSSSPVLMWHVCPLCLHRHRGTAYALGRGLGPTGGGLPCGGDLLGRVLWSSLQPSTLPSYLKSSALFALHDAVTRGRTHWVEQATDVGAARPQQPFWRCFLIEAGCGLMGAQLSLEYMRVSLSGGGTSMKAMFFVTQCPSMLALGACAAAARGIVVSTGGRKPIVQSICSWMEFFLEVAAERQGALYLGYHCPLVTYLGVVLWGILNFLPWGLMVIPCKWLVEKYFGPDPIVAQKASLSRVSRDLKQSERGRSELADAPQRANEFFANMEISSLWWRVRAVRGTHQLLRRLQLPMAAVQSETQSSCWDAAQDQLDELLLQLAARRGEDLKVLLQQDDGSVNEECVFQVFDSATAPIAVRRNDMARSALTQIADRSVEDLLLGVTALHFPGLQDTELNNMLGLRVQFMGEDAVDMGGVRKEFMDCFAEALTREEGTSPLSLIERLCLLSLGADSTWRPLPCDEDDRGYLWALGRLLALSFVYRCPCPLQLSLLVLQVHLRSSFATWGCPTVRSWFLEPSRTTYLATRWGWQTTERAGHVGHGLPHFHLCWWQSRVETWWKPHICDRAEQRGMRAALVRRFPHRSHSPWNRMPHHGISWIGAGGLTVRQQFGCGTAANADLWHQWVGRGWMGTKRGHRGSAPGD